MKLRGGVWGVWFVVCLGSAGTLLAAPPSSVMSVADQEPPRAVATEAEDAARIVEAPEIPEWQLALDAAMGGVNGWISAVFVREPRVRLSRGEQSGCGAHVARVLVVLR